MYHHMTTASEKGKDGQLSKHDAELEAHLHRMGRMEFFMGCLHVIFVGIFFWGAWLPTRTVAWRMRFTRRVPWAGFVCQGSPKLVAIWDPNLQDPWVNRSGNSQVMAQSYGSQAWLGFPQVAAGWIHGDPKTGGLWKPY